MIWILIALLALSLASGWVARRERLARRQDAEQHARDPDFDAD